MPKMPKSVQCQPEPARGSSLHQPIVFLASSMNCARPVFEIEVKPDGCLPVLRSRSTAEGGPTRRCVCFQMAKFSHFSAKATEGSNM
jgi:hypothetical protein